MYIYPKMIKVGCCGFRGGMSNYFKNFKVVEIQHTFYKIPELKTVKRWKKLSPPDFEFTMKAWQLITHPPSSPTYRKAGIKIEDESKYGFFKPTSYVFHAFERCMEIAKILDASIIIFQSPPSFKETRENIENMKNFFSSISSHDIKYAWEPRAEWKKDTILQLCHDYGLIHCVDPFKNRRICGMPAYYRLHGIGGYNYRYTEEDLKKLQIICREEREAYCLFNNIYMLENALEFKKMVDSV